MPMTRTLPLALFAAALLACGGAKTPTEPTKELLAAQLTALAASLEAGDADAAVAHMMLPPGRSLEEMKPMLPKLVERQEISAAGVKLLTERGTFGKLTEVFPEAGPRRAGRLGINVEECYGMALGGAEVMARWTGTEFKIFRLDDVGKLDESAKPPAAAPSAATPPAAGEGPPSEEEVAPAGE